MHLIACIGDIHVGHPAAVWPKGFLTKEGNEIKPNKVQEKLLSYWDDFFGRPEVREAEYIVNMAESIEGGNVKEMGMGLMTADLNEQVRAFVQLMAPQIKNKTYIQMVGSTYHGLKGYGVEQIICAELKKAEPTANIIFGGHLMRWKHKPTGKYGVLVHKISGAVLYKVTALDRWSLYLSAIKSKIGDPDFVLCAHHHQYFAEQTPSRMLVQLPCWKVWHPIKDASRYVSSQPTIGGVVLELSEDYVSNRLFKYPVEHLFDAVVRL